MLPVDLTLLVSYSVHYPTVCDPIVPDIGQKHTTLALSQYSTPDLSIPRLFYSLFLCTETRALPQTLVFAKFTPIRGRGVDFIAAFYN